jgi:hypothetical protein
MTEPLRTTGRANLYRTDGTRRPDAEVLEESGNIGLRLALLDDAMHRRASSAEADSLYPARLFVSYKWGSPEEDAWIADLACALAERGWDVVFDRRRDESVDRTVEEFVARLVNCRVFVAVLSPAYVASAFQPSRPTWVFDEMQCALIARDRMRLIGIVPPPDLAKAPAPRREPEIRMPQIPALIVQALEEPEFEAVFRCDDANSLRSFLDASLTYTGPALEADERAWVAERLERKDDETALHEVVERHPFVSGAWRRLVVLLRDRGELAAAAEASAQALGFVHDPIERLPFLREHIELLKRAGQRASAVRAAVQLIEDRPRDGVAHFHLGDLLNDADEPWAARSHLLLACHSADAAPAAHNTLGVVYMGLGLLALAAVALEQALCLDATLGPARRNLAKVRAAQAETGDQGISEVAGPLPGCSKCDAIFVPRPGRPLTCAACGASRPGSSAPCEVCGTVGVTPIVATAGGWMPVRCPICRTGTVTAKDRVRL